MRLCYCVRTKNHRVGKAKERPAKARKMKRNKKKIAFLSDQKCTSKQHKSPRQIATQKAASSKVEAPKPSLTPEQLKAKQQEFREEGKRQKRRKVGNKE